MKYKTLIFSFLFLFSALSQSGNTNSVESSKENSKKSIQRSDIELQEKSIQRIESKNVIQFNTVAMNLQTEINQLMQLNTRKTPTILEQNKLETQLAQLKILNNKSFEYYLFYYQVGNYDFSRIKSLKKAEKLKPYAAGVLKDLSAYYFIKNQPNQLDKYLHKMNSMKLFSSASLEYAQDVLESLPSNTILITHGDNDTYPLLIKQEVNNIRKDVQIISLDHLQSEEFRKKLKKQGLMMPNSSVIDTQYLNSLLRLNSFKSILVSGSVPRAYLNQAINSPKVTGLAFSVTSKKGSKGFNLKQYYKLKERISAYLENDAQSSLLENYLPFLFEVRNQLITDNRKMELQEIEQMIREIGRKTKQIKKVNTLLNK